MNKKSYIKPELKMIGLRTEERLASCGDTWLINQGDEACYTNIFAVTDASHCWVASNPQAAS